MSMEKCIWRLTKEQADWFNLDCGYIAEGKRADLVVIDSNHFSRVTDEVQQQPIEEFDNYPRLVNRNPGLIHYVLVNGKIIFHNDEFVEGYGKNKKLVDFCLVRRVKLKKLIQ